MLLATNKVSECIHPGMHGTTFGGGPLACAVALQLIAVLEKDKMLKHIRKVGDYFMEQLQKLQKKHPAIVDVRGQGLMIGMELESAESAKQVFQQMLKQGTIVNRTDETVIRFLPPSSSRNNISIKPYNSSIRYLLKAQKQRQRLPPGGANKHDASQNV